LEIVTNSVAIVLTVLYGVLLSGEFSALKDRQVLSGIGTRWIGATVAIHLVALIVRGIEVGSCPVASRWETLSLLALLIVSMHLVLAGISRDRSTLIFGIAVTFLLQLGSASFSLGESNTIPTEIDSISSLHAFTAWIGVAGVSTAGIHGVLWLLLKRSIKTGQFGILFHRLSSLESLSRLIRLATVIATVSLVITMISAVFLGEVLTWSTGPVKSISLALALLFGVLALVPRSTGTVTAWRAWISVTGLGGVVFIIVWIIRFGPHA